MMFHRSALNAPERIRQAVWACVFFWSVLSFVVIHRFFLSTVVVRGDSMDPTLRDGERLFLNRWIYHVRAPREQEVVVIRDLNLKRPAVKRVVGLPGDRIRIHNGWVVVNDRVIAETYLGPNVTTDPGNMGAGHYEVIPEHYFVMGDNRNKSVDSRHYGGVNRRDILGKVWEVAFGPGSPDSPSRGKK